MDRMVKIRGRMIGATLVVAAALTGATAPARAEPLRQGPSPQAVALAALERAQEPHFRWIYTDDAEIDGLSEFMRMLLYAGDYADSLQGIVYTSSEFHYRGDPNASPPVAPFGWSGGDLPDGVDRLTTYQSIIGGTGYFGADGGYAAAYPHLRQHDPRYPTP